MPEITVTVRDKIAQAEQGAAIVCGNSDYTIRFDFDSEWTGYPVRTARFAYVRDGVRLYQDVLFSGNSVQAPVMWGVTAVTVGVYAGNLRTTTGAVIPCTAAVTQSDPVHPAPAPDAYEQLLAYLEQAGSGGKPVTASLFANAIRGTTAYATRVNVGQVNMMQYQWEQGTGSPSTGEFSGTSTSRIRSQTYVPVPEGAERYNVQAKLADGTELRFVPYSYGEGQGSAFISAPDWQNYNAEYAIPTGAKYVRLLLAKSSGNIAYTNLASCLLTFY